MDLDDEEYYYNKFIKTHISKKELKEKYISKDEVLKALGYEENSEAYNRMDSEEKVISLIRLVNAECNRLEDIEDKKIMLEEHNIENMRDKYWKDKIKDKIKELEEKAEKVIEHYKGTYACLDEYLNAKSKIQGYKELLDEE